MPPTSARERIAALFDQFDEFVGLVSTRDPISFPGYEDAILFAERSSGESEAVVTGMVALEGHEAVAAVFEFGFLGGSMGEAVGAKLEHAMKKASEFRRPFIAITSTGGARMQEGMAALAQMPRTVAASMELARAGVPRISVLAHPTTGGVYASFGSLADIVVAEAGATLGFAGPRVAETMSGKRLPPGSHTAEAALFKGLVDAVANSEDLRNTLARLLAILEPAS
jgi:acetyl-CoA carboxylase carboxyl transferase subunit beta